MRKLSKVFRHGLNKSFCINNNVVSTMKSLKEQLNVLEKPRQSSSDL